VILSGLRAMLLMIVSHQSFKRELKDLKLFILVKNKLQVLLLLATPYAVKMSSIFTLLFAPIQLQNSRLCMSNLASLAVLLVSTSTSQIPSCNCCMIILLAGMTSMFDSNGLKMLLLFGTTALQAMSLFLTIWMAINVDMVGELLHR